MSIESVRKVKGSEDTRYLIDIIGKDEWQGGWLYECGHFIPSTFVQIIHSDGECYPCKDARKVLAEAQEFRDKKQAGVSKFRSKY